MLLLLRIEYQQTMLSLIRSDIDSPNSIRTLFLSHSGIVLPEQASNNAGKSFAGKLLNSATALSSHLTSETVDAPDKLLVVSKAATSAWRQRPSRVIRSLCGVFSATDVIQRHSMTKAKCGLSLSACSCFDCKLDWSICCIAP